MCGPYSQCHLGHIVRIIHQSEATNLMTTTNRNLTGQHHQTDLFMSPATCHTDVYLQVPDFDIATAVDAYLGAGVPPAKINLGLGLYGRTFKLAGGDDQPGLAPANGGLKRSTMQF
jgi:GH18 family chitinase